MYKIAAVLLLGGAMMMMAIGNDAPEITEPDHSITLQEARDYVTNYQRQAPQGGRLGGLFERDQVLQVLAQEGCVGIRYYHGLDEAGRQVMVLVGYDKDFRDMTDGIMLERAFPCPPLCDDTKALLGQELAQQ